MNPNLEYEKFTREVYEKLVNADVVRTIVVRHDVKLAGKSGQSHQIDVYWEYEIAGLLHKVAVECKNYNKPVPIGKVRDFYGVLADLNGVKGIMVSKIGYQKGAKKYATEHGITLKELRTPNWGEAIIGSIEININMNIRHCLYSIDIDWAQNNKFDLPKYKLHLDRWNLNGGQRWANATHIPLSLKDHNLRDSTGRVISYLEKLEKQLPESSDSDIIFKFADAYVDTRDCGLVKINEVKYEYEHKNHQTIMSIDAQEFVKAILKDAINGEIRFVSKN